MTAVSQDSMEFSEAALGEPTSSFSDSRIRQGETAPARYRILDPDGSYDRDDLPGFSVEEHRDIYYWMLLQKVYDERMVKLQRRGEMGTVATARGQEASTVGVSFGLEDRDWLFPYGRESAAMMRHGVAMRDIMLYWLGVMEANRFTGSNTLPFAIAVGTHLPVGVGYAWGLRLDGEDAIAAMMLGDGQPSTGEAQTAMNFAGVVDAPAVFFCLNNQYAISVPFSKQTAANSVAQKALAWGLDGIRVDGNDVLAVVDAMRRARARALDGTPVLLEAVTYRIEAHTTNDDPSRYRDDAEVDWWRERDPFDRYRAFLEAEGYWSEIDEDAMRADIEDRFDEAREQVQAYESGGLEELFAHVYDEMTPALRDQLEALESFLGARPDAYDYIEERPKG
ncbi:MAG: thiamine pyrophosphate-dependent enzyme [Halobacteriales archaeon]